MKDDKAACSLDPERLGRRLSEIEAIGADALTSCEASTGRHVLRFRASDETRRRLEELVAAEAECCSFLDLALDEAGDELVLTVSAPSHAEEVATEFARAFSR